MRIAEIDQLLGTAYRENPVASLGMLQKIIRTKSGFAGISSQREKNILDIIGTACLALLRLEDASAYFKKSGNMTRLKSVFEIGVRHGKYALVKDLLEYGEKRGIGELGMSREGYCAFLKEKAFPYVPLYRDEPDAFSIDEDVVNAIVSEIGLTVESVIAEAARFMEASGSRNIVKKFILAHYSKDQSLIKRYQDEFNQKAAGGRQRIADTVKTYCNANGITLVQCLQAGDADNYFPSVAHIFLVEKQGKRYVLKENIRLHQDYSRLGGYSMEKEILETVRHPYIVGYRKTVFIDEHEFLMLDFMPGVTLERYAHAENLLPLRKALDIALVIARVIEYLHSQNIISMDIKDKNIMYDGSSATLFDFGVSQIVPSPKGLTDDTHICSLLTTPEYVAPEMALTFKAYPKTDIFQLGILFYKLLVGKNPFVRYDIADFTEGDEYRESEIIKFVLPTIFREWDDSPKVFAQHSEIKTLLGAMLRKDTKERPSPKEVIKSLEDIEI